MNFRESEAVPESDPVEIELSSTVQRQQRRSRPRSNSYRWAVLTLTAIVAGAVGFAVARSTSRNDVQPADRRPTASGETTATDAASDDISSSTTVDAGTDSNTPAASGSSVPTTEIIIENSSSANVFDVSGDELDELIAPATYVGPDRVDARVAGQPIEIVAQTENGLVDINLARADANQTDSALVPVDGETDKAASLKVWAAGPDWIVIGNDWESPLLLRDGNQQLIVVDTVSVAWSNGQGWGWILDTGATDTQVNRIDFTGSVIEGSTITLPSLGMWLAPGRRMVGAYGGSAIEFTPDGERPLGRGFPLVTGAHRTLVVRCGDQLECELFAIDLDTGDERAIADAALAADLIDYQYPSLSPDDRYVALSKSDVTVIVDLINGERVASIPGYSSDDLATTSGWSNDSRWWFFNDDSDGPSVLDTTTGERFPIFDPTLDIDPWTSLTVRSQ